MIGHVAPGAQVLGPIDEQEQDGRVRDPLHEHRQQVLRGLVDPVHVLNHQGQRVLGGFGQDEVPDGIEGALTDHGRRLAGEELVAGILAQQVTEVRA